MKNTIYVIGLRSVFELEFQDFKKGKGFYFDIGFRNSGVIRYSMDGELVLLEETKEKFKPEHLDHEEVTIYTHSEILAYLKINKANWEEEI